MAKHSLSVSTLMMASNTLGQSTLSEYELGPSCSLEGGASPFTLGEYVLVRIPQEIKVDGYVDNEATARGTDLPPTSNGTSPQHFAFIRQMYLNLDDSWILEVYPVVSFTRSGGAVQGYRQLADAGKAALLPLPNLSLRHPTPAPFGTPLNFGTWSTFRDSFLLAIPMRFEMKRQRPFKRMIPPLVMSALDLARIDRYRGYILSNIQTHIHGNQSHFPLNGGSGDDQRSSHDQHGRTGDGGGPAASRTTSATNSPTIIGDGGGENVDGAEPKKYSVNSFHGLLVLEGVDEDAEDADATMRDELILMAHCSPIWEEELRRYLEREEREREQMQKERAERLARWREGIPEGY